MTIVLWLFVIQAMIGTFDTIYYHEWRARLPARGEEAAPELRLHAGRDFLYAVIFGTLPWVAWQGGWAIVLIAVLVAEIILTLWDFVVEITVRRNLGDVYGGERITHAIMGILYGAALAYILPTLITWWALPAGLHTVSYPVPDWLPWCLTIMAAGVFLSGVRDLYASYGLPYGDWPWGDSR